jgi:two-component system phosphate regulon sensor histidine kinase PhoR
MIVPQLVDSLTAFAAEKGVAVELTGFEDGPAWVTGDRDELFRAFENLIENAIKYGASGERVKVTLQRDPGRGEWRVDVQDFGPGIAAHHLPRLTERFYRADVQESRALGGTGLGLALVKHIVSRHRGRLLIESREGEGAVFAIALPQFQPSEK